MHHIRSFAPLAAALLLPAPAFSEALETAPVLVTATRTAQSADESLAAVTVITREDIQRLQADSLQEVLKTAPGIQINNNGGLGKLTSLFLRGTESDHVLVLIDGVRAGSATTGAAAFQHIPVDQIERIEIVRGPRSALYGPEAIGGVIQIFTRKGRGAPRPEGRIAYGTHATREAAVSLGGGDGGRWYRIGLSGIDTAGYNACTGDPATFAGCAVTEPDDDGYTNAAIQFGGGLRLDNGISLELRALHSRGDVEYDGSFQNQADAVVQSLSGTLDYEVTDAWTMRLLAGRSLDKSKNYKDGAFSSRFDTRRTSISWQNDIAAGETGLLTLGLDYYDDRVESSTSYATDSRYNRGLFAQYQTRLGGHDLVLALRHDENEQFGGHVTGNIDVGHDLANGWRVTASYGTAFKAPTFNELYFPGYGNPDLDPERSRSLEIGLRGKAGPLDWSAHAFETRIRDLIAYDAALFAPNNLSKAHIRGAEVELAGTLAMLDARLALTLLDPESRDAATSGNLLPRRARRTLSLQLDRRWSRLAVGLTLTAQSKRYDDLNNTRPLAGYATVDLRGTWEIARDWTLALRVNNLFDRQYELARHYPQDGRNLLLTLRWQP